MTIFLDQPPYNIKADWKGTDSCATDWTSAIQDAICSCSFSKPTGEVNLDFGTNGDVLVLPAGGIKTKSLVIPAGISLVGQGYNSTVLKWADGDDPTHDFIDLGDSTKHQAAMGSRLQHMTLCKPVGPAAFGTAMVRSDNMQDTWDMLLGVYIYAGQRHALKFQVGWGGATFIHMRNVMWSSSGQEADSGAGAIFDYGDATQVFLEGLEPSAGMDDHGMPIANSKGVCLRGGRYDIRGIHGEQIEVVLDIMAAHETVATIISGHPTTRYVVKVENNPALKGTIDLSRVRRNGSMSCYTVWNDLPSGVSQFNDFRSTVSI